MNYPDEFDDITPAQVYRQTFRWAPVLVVTGVVIVVVGAVITFVGWNIGWWFTEQNVNRQNTVYQNSYATQQSDIDQMESAIQAISGAVDNGQAAADAQLACKMGARVTQLPAGDQSWYSQNCSGPALLPSSKYAQ